jgi:hypothetical protein
MTVPIFANTIIAKKFLKKQEILISKPELKMIGGSYKK